MISNEIFEHYRIKQREVTKAKNLLRLNGYSIRKNTDVKENNNNQINKL